MKPIDTPVAFPDRSIGDLIRDARNLSAEEVERVLQHQREKGLRFGEAAVALGLASPEDVLSALAQQFHYPLGNEARRLASPELVTLNAAFAPMAEAVRAVRSQLNMRWNRPDAGTRRALAVVSACRGDGRTFFTANLAVALAQLGGRTLLVDACLRHPRQHEVFDIENTRGLSSVLSGRMESEPLRAVAGVPGLFVLPAGAVPPNPLELLERPAFGLLMRELSNQFDHVLVDTSAATEGADALMTAARCGGALLLGRRNVGRLDALMDLVHSLPGAQVELFGAVYNEF